MVEIFSSGVSFDVIAASLSRRVVSYDKNGTCVCTIHGAASPLSVINSGLRLYGVCNHCAQIRITPTVAVAIAVTSHEGLEYCEENGCEVLVKDLKCAWCEKPFCSKHLDKDDTCSNCADDMMKGSLIC